MGRLIAQDKVQNEALRLFPGLFHASDSSGILLPEGHDGKLINPNAKHTTIDGFKITDDFDIKSMMDDAIDPTTGAMRDLRIDDRDLPLAKNFADFTINYFEANAPWVRQMLTYLTLFAEYCPRCSNKKWLRIHEIDPAEKTENLLDNLVLLEYGKCKKCGTSKRELVAKGELRFYKELVLVWGQRSGKSLTGSMAMGYLTHRWIKLPKLASLVPDAIQPFTPLTATMVSLTFTKAISLLWAPFLSIINLTPWFTQYHELLDFYGNKYGTELYRKKDLFIKYWHRNLHFYPSHPNASILRGDTRIFGAVDELGLFNNPKDKVGEDADETSERANAKEAVNSLSTSLATVNNAVTTLFRYKKMNNIPPTMLFGLSSPKHLRDMVMRRLNLSRTEEGRKTMLGSQMATWEINPNLPRDSDYIRGKFNEDPIAAMRDLGAQPPRVAHTWLHFSSYSKERYPFIGGPNMIRMEHEYTESEVWGRLMNATPGKCKIPTCISVDAGYSDNSFGITATGIDASFEFKLRVPAICEVIPRGGLTINFNRMYTSVILPFIKAMNGQFLVADRWNSLELLHRAKDDLPGLEVKQITLRPRHFDGYKQALNNNNIVLPTLDKEEANKMKKDGVDDYRSYFPGKPVQHLLWQFMTVQDGGARDVPGKADDYTDDVFRAHVLGIVAMSDSRIVDIVKEQRVKHVEDAGGGGVVGLYASRGGFR